MEKLSIELFKNASVKNPVKLGSEPPERFRLLKSKKGKIILMAIIFVVLLIVFSGLVLSVEIKF